MQKRIVVSEEEDVMILANENLVLTRSLIVPEDLRYDGEGFLIRTGSFKFFADVSYDDVVVSAYDIFYIKQWCVFCIILVILLICALLVLIIESVVWNIRRKKDVDYFDDNKFIIGGIIMFLLISTIGFVLLSFFKGNGCFDNLVFKLEQQEPI